MVTLSLFPCHGTSSLPTANTTFTLNNTLTRPNLAYAVQQVCLFMHDPREPQLALVKRILRYVKVTLSAGVTLTLAMSNLSRHTQM